MPESIAYTARHFTDENGLPQNSVKAIVADKDGFIWFTTENGLVRYDGQRFLVFDNSTLSIHSNRLTSFFPASHVPDSSYNRFFALSDRLEYLLVKDGKVVPVTGGYENFMSGMPFSQEVKQDKVFISLSMPGRYGENISLKTYIVPDGDGGFFMCMPGKVSYYKGLQKEYDVSYPATDTRTHFRIGHTLFWYTNKGQFGKTGAKTSNGISLTGDVLDHVVYRAGTSNFEIYWNNAAGKAFLYLDKFLYLLKEDKHGNLATRLILSGFDCAINNIASIFYEENTRTVFLGSINKGLFTFSPQQFKTLNAGDDSKDNIYYALSAWGNNQILSAQGNLLGPAGSSVLPKMKKTGNADRYSMLIDRKGYIWTKSGYNINKFDKEGRNLVASWHLGDKIAQLYEGKDGWIWIGSDNKGLYRMDPFADSATPQLFPTRSLIHNISCLQEDGSGNLWVGTGVGLYRLNLLSGIPDTIKGLEKSYIRSLHIPYPGEIWITTYGHGFFLYSGQKLTRFPGDKGGYLNTAHCLVEDSLGFCWVTTNKGLFQASKNDLLSYAQGKQQHIFYLYHARDEGFYTNEFNGGCQPCAVKLANGNIVFPSLNGVVSFAPGVLQTALPDKKIFIDRIEVDEVPVQIKDTITLSQKFKLLKLYSSTPYIGNDYNVNMQYAWVKGSEKPVWLSLNMDKIISQSTLTHGVYNLFIRKMNGFGRNNYSYSKTIVIVPPSFYETTGFYAGLAGVLIFLVWAYVRLRFRNIRKRNRQLKKLVNEHTYELRQALSALSVSEQNIRRQLHIREILLASISHDIGSPLKYITMMAEELSVTLEKENVPENIKKHAGSIFQSGHYLYHLTRNLLQYLRISGESSSIHFEQFGLRPLIEKKIPVFLPMANERSVVLINNVPEQVYIYNDLLLIEVVVHNLLDNAIKATQDGEITIEVATIDSQMHLIIKDTGPGIPVAVADYYNNPNKEKTGSTRPHTGFGLDIVTELIRLTGAKLKIETSAEGTSVHIIFGKELPATEH